MPHRRLGPTREEKRGERDEDEDDVGVATLASPDRCLGPRVGPPHSRPSLAGGLASPLPLVDAVADHHQAREREKEWEGEKKNERERETT